MKVQVILVPYDVERKDTSTAKAPRELLERGFEEALKGSGFELFLRELSSSAKGEKADIVATVAREAARAVARASSRGRFPLVVSAGCQTAVGVAHGLQRRGLSFSVVWIDAHGDFNTAETTPSGYWDGMALGAVCGRSLTEVYKFVELRPVPFRRIVHLGGRALDAPEIEDFERLNVLVVPPEKVGEANTIREVTERVGEVEDYYLHVDLDGLDPAIAPAVNMPERDGIQIDDLLSCLRPLGRPAAITLSGMNFEKCDEAAGRVQVATCHKLVETALRW